MGDRGYGGGEGDLRFEFKSGSQTGLGDSWNPYEASPTFVRAQIVHATCLFAQQNSKIY